MEVKSFDTAQAAFEYYYDNIVESGFRHANTLCMYNVGFYINSPVFNHIATEWREWKASYAEQEWQWYMSEVPYVTEIKKLAKIWDKMHNGDDRVNSNYGYQWSRSGQLEYVINELKRDPQSRRAVLTIHDAKEHFQYKYDTPCTLSIAFSITYGRLNMTVIMRSNDLWFGFCNDQYCFSRLQQLVANRLGLLVGWYYHFSMNLHLYDKHVTKKKDYYKKLKYDMKLTNEFEPIREWARFRGLYEHGDPKTQLVKLTEEVGELAQGLLKNNQLEIKDAIGDCVVVLTNLAAITGLKFEDCVNHAYEEIKNRKGAINNGTFVKENHATTTK